MITRLPAPISLRFALDALGYVVASTRDDGFYGLRRGVCGCVRVARTLALARRKLSSQNAAYQPGGGEASTETKSNERKS